MTCHRFLNYALMRRPVLERLDETQRDRPEGVREALIIEIQTS